MSLPSAVRSGQFLTINDAREYGGGRTPAPRAVKRLGGRRDVRDDETASAPGQRFLEGAQQGRANAGPLKILRHGAAERNGLLILKVREK